MNLINRVALACAVIPLFASVQGCRPSDLVNSIRPSTAPSPEASDRPVQPVAPTEKPQPEVKPQPEAKPQPVTPPEPAQTRSMPQVDNKVAVLKKLNCQEANQADYIYGTYRVGWTINGDRHEGLLKMEGNIGVMQVNFFDRQANAADSVVQGMALATCPQGLLLAGVNPLAPSTQAAHPTYAADNIVMRRSPNGEILLMVVDDRGVSAPVEIQKVND